MAYRLLSDGRFVMIDALFNQPTYVATKKMMDATALRHEAIAGNIANIQTPGYKRVDVSPAFEQELKTAINSGDLDKIRSLSPLLAEDSKAVALRQDGNTVDLEGELIKLSQNTLAHTVETQMVSGALLKLRLAITGRTA